MQRPENPFGSRFTRPGALPFLPPNSGSHSHDLSASQAGNAWLENLVQQLLSRPRSAIVGPHGCGKTTLLRLLEERVETSFGENLVTATLRIGETAQPLWDGLENLLRTMSKQNDQSTLGLLVIDGYEQLNWLGRRQLAWRIYQRPIRLLVTAHQPPNGIQIIANLHPDASVARRLAHYLLSDFPEFSASLETVFQSAWQAAGGNTRDVWAILYEWFESQLHQSSQGPNSP